MKRASFLGPTWLKSHLSFVWGLKNRPQLLHQKLLSFVHVTAVVASNNFLGVVKYFLVYEGPPFLLTLPTDGLLIGSLLIDSLQNDIVSC